MKKYAILWRRRGGYLGEATHYPWICVTDRPYGTIPGSANGAVRCLFPYCQFQSNY